MVGKKLVLKEILKFSDPDGEQLIKSCVNSGKFVFQNVYLSFEQIKF